MFKPTLLIVSLACALTACSKPETAATEAPAPAKPLLLVSADLLVAQEGSISQGPLIAGSLQPERRADLRAEVSGIVLEVLKDNGDPVKKGDTLVRLDPTSIRDQLLSAEEAERSMSVAADQAARQLKRQKELAQQKLIAVEALESAEVKNNQAEAELASARARVVQARQQLDKTEVRAPFDGVVGTRQVSAGDTAQIGKELMQVIDPSTMRFEGLIASDQVGKVALGNPVSFRVNGYPDQQYVGTVQRVNPSADVATRQVQVLVALPAGSAPQVAGLYAEGRIQILSRAALMVPESVLVREGDQAFVWQIKDNTLSRKAVTLGEQDPRSGDVEVKQGLVAGDKLLRHPKGLLTEGVAVQFGSSSSQTSAPEAAVARK